MSINFHEINGGVYATYNVQIAKKSKRRINRVAHICGNAFLMKRVIMIDGVVFLRYYLDLFFFTAPYSLEPRSVGCEKTVHFIGPPIH